MKRNRKQRDRYASGFTLIEVLVVMIIVGILSAISAPSWLGFFANQSLSSAQTQALSTMRLAQSNAKRSQNIWQASFRNTSTGAQYAAHLANPTSLPANYWNSLPWQNFNNGVRIVDTIKDPAKTTFTKIDATPDVFRVQFKPQGTPNGKIGKITFATNNSDRKKCVIISTLLGAMRTAENEKCIP